MISPPTMATPWSSSPEERGLSEALADLAAPLADYAALAGASSLPLVAALIRRMASLVRLLDDAGGAGSLVSAADSLAMDLRRARAALRASSPRSPSPAACTAVRDLARSFGLLLLGAPPELRPSMAALQREMMEVRIGDLASPAPGLGDVLLRINGDLSEASFAAAIDELEVMVAAREGFAGGGEELDGLIRTLGIRLGSAKTSNRFRIIVLLRNLANLSDDNKESMTSMEALSTIVRSLSRDAGERRETVALLLQLSDEAKVRHRIGRLQGCIVMLVALLNGDDTIASCDAGKLLGALSGYTQNVLLMAEAGFFAPLVQYLNEGSEMNRTLMAAAISKMELTDQRKAALGEEGSIAPLVRMLDNGKLESKLSALGALRNLSGVPENVPRLFDAGVTTPLFRLLFSVTSVALTLREPASAIIAMLARSQLMLAKEDAAEQMLSLLNLSTPAIQLNILRALDSIVKLPGAFKVRAQLSERGAVQLLLPFLTAEGAAGIMRASAMSVLYALSKDFAGEVAEQLAENHLRGLVDVVATSGSMDERAAALGVLGNLPPTDRKATEILVKKGLLPVLIFLLDSATMDSSSTRATELAAGLLVRFTSPSDRKLQRAAASHGAMASLTKLLSSGSAAAKAMAATSLAQMSQSTAALSKKKKKMMSSSFSCVPRRSSDSGAACRVHGGRCSVKGTFCIVMAGAVAPLVRVLEGKDREADEAALAALATLMAAEETWEEGSRAVEEAMGVPAITRVIQIGSLKAQSKALWMLERVFRVPANRDKYGGDSAQLLLVYLAQDGDPVLKPMVARILAHLELLQMQSTYF